MSHRLEISVKSNRVGIHVIGASLVIIASAGAVFAQAASESLPVFVASKILPGAALNGPNYEVLPVVRNNGFQNLYTVKVDGRSYTIVGNAMMKVRLQELAALERMEQLKRTDVYKDAVIKSATSPLRTAKNFITSPIETTKGVASGIGTMFSNIGHSLFGGASKYESGVLKTTLGFDAAKRKIAHKFGIDPYTSFQPVLNRLNDISWAGVAGGLTVSAGFRLTPAPAQGVLNVTKTGDAMNRLVRDNTPADLKRINASKLRQMGVNEAVADMFLEHPQYSPTKKTHLVNALASMGIWNRQAFIQRAILVQNEDMAFFMRRWAEMMAAYHIQVSRVERIVKVGNAPFLQRRDGKIIGLFPVDHLAWTAEISNRHATNMNRIANVAGVTSGEIWIEGTISQKARQALESQRWIVKENVAGILGLN